MASVSGLVVTFAHDINNEDAEKLSELLRWLDGVVDVQPVADDIDTMLARGQINNEWRRRLIRLLDEARQ